MTFRLSLRNKLVYTFLAGSLLTVALFGLVIKGIMNDYFQRLAAARRDFISAQGEGDAVDLPPAALFPGTDMPVDQVRPT